MDITTKEYKRCAVIEVSGRIDSATAPELAEVFNDLTTDGQCNLVLDMEDVEFISSAGLRVLIDVQKTCQRLNRGRLVLAEVPQHICESFELAGFDALFHFYDDQIDAVGSF